LPAITAALFTRYRSRESNPFSERLLAALRNQFGGHAVKKNNG
jgi:6-phosphogluconate dehydrogenase